MPHPSHNRLEIISLQESGQNTGHEHYIINSYLRDVLYIVKGLLTY